MLGFSIMRLCRVVAGGVFLATTLAAYAQIKGPKQFDNRVEGTKPVPTALAQFTPIALTRNAIHFQQNANLYVRFFVPQLPANLKKSVFLKASERQGSANNYFMEAKDPSRNPGLWNVFGPWPTRDVIDVLKIDADNIAVLAGYDKDNAGTVYLPVDIYEKDNQLTQHTYTFHFITSKFAPKENQYLSTDKHGCTQIFYENKNADFFEQLKIF